MCASRPGMASFTTTPSSNVSSSTTNNTLDDGVLKFNIHAQNSAHSRASTLVLPHGPIRTPVFMPVGTKGTIKGLTTQQLYNPELNPEIILGNTYHLALQVAYHIPTFFMRYVIYIIYTTITYSLEQKL
mgnify:CR=1 FL=1